MELGAAAFGALDTFGFDRAGAGLADEAVAVVRRERRRIGGDGELGRLDPAGRSEPVVAAASFFENWLSSW